MLCAGFSTVAVDTSATRNTERLSAFLSELYSADPSDNYFDRYPTIDRLQKSRKVGAFGRQIRVPIVYDKSPNMARAGNYDLVNTSGSSLVRDVVYAMKNIFSSINISWEELREIAGNDHMAIDRLKIKRAVELKSLAKFLNEDLFASSVVGTAIQSLATVVDSSGSAGDLSQSTLSAWAAHEVAHSAAYEAGAYAEMLGIVNDIEEKGGRTSWIVTTKDIYESCENSFDVDVRYAGADGTVNRGWTGLKFKQKDLFFDSDCTSQAMYFIDSDHLQLCVDSDGDARFADFDEPHDQWAQSAKFVWRGQVICDKRNAHGKITGIS